MRNVPNTLIVSLSLGDVMLILVSVPLTSTLYTFTSWPYGAVACKLNHFLQTWSLGVSVFTLTTLSLDRYLVIMDPLAKHKGKVSDGGILCLPPARPAEYSLCLRSVSLALPPSLSLSLSLPLSLKKKKKEKSKRLNAINRRFKSRQGYLKITFFFLYFR